LRQPYSLGERGLRPYCTTQKSFVSEREYFAAASCNYSCGASAAEAIFVLEINVSIEASDVGLWIGVNAVISGRTFIHQERMLLLSPNHAPANAGDPFGPPAYSRFDYCPSWFFIISMISFFTASRLKVAGACIGG
jgi:hypothetical protein